MDNFKTIYRILRYLEKAMDYDEVGLSFISAEHLNLTERRWAVIMEMLAKERYVEGISVKRLVDGEVALSVSAPRITLRGLEYLQENSMMKKAANIARGAKKGARRNYPSLNERFAGYVGDYVPKEWEVRGTVGRES